MSQPWVSWSPDHLPSGIETLCVRQFIQLADVMKNSPKIVQTVRKLTVPAFSLYNIYSIPSIDFTRLQSWSHLRYLELSPPLQSFLAPINITEPFLHLTHLHCSTAIEIQWFPNLECFSGAVTGSCEDSRIVTFAPVYPHTCFPPKTTTLVLAQGFEDMKVVEHDRLCEKIRHFFFLQQGTICHMNFSFLPHELETLEITVPLQPIYMPAMPYLKRLVISFAGWNGYRYKSHLTALRSLVLHGSHDSDMFELDNFPNLEEVEAQCSYAQFNHLPKLKRIFFVGNFRLQPFTLPLPCLYRGSMGYGAWCREKSSNA
jgi:hypothetical protein